MAELMKTVNELSNYRASFCKNNFITVINGYQIFATVNENKYDVLLMKNYSIIKKGTIDRNDVVYFLLYIKKSTIC